MAKLIVFAAILVALLALAQASRFTITTTVDEEDLDLDLDNPYGGQSRRCQLQILQQLQKIRRCQQYLSTRRGQSEEMDATIEQYGEGQQGQKQQQLQECCQGLRNLENRCQCQGIREAVRRALEQLGQGQQGSKEVQQIMEAARYLPRQCQLKIQQCPV